MTLSQCRPVDSGHVEVRWGHYPQHHTKVNRYNRDGCTQGHLQLILHYPGQGNSEYAVDLGYGKSISCTLQIYVSGRWIFLSKITPRFWADFDELVLTPTSSIGYMERYLLRCRWFSILRNSVLSGFSFSLFIDIQDWTEAKNDCKPFSAAAESPDAKETYSWLFSV